MHDRLLASLRLAALVLWTIVLLVPALTLRLLRAHLPSALARRWHRGCCAIAGGELRVVGTPDPRKGLLFVANHVSYLDIIALGGQLHAAFVAKAEVAHWPGIGLLARLGRTLFVRRNGVHSARQCATLAGRLRRRRPLDPVRRGHRQRRQPRAALQERPVRCARATRRRSAGHRPAGHDRLPAVPRRPRDRALAAGFASPLDGPGLPLLVELRFHEPLPAAAFASRKTLAHAERQVASGLAEWRAAA